MYDIEIFEISAHRVEDGDIVEHVEFTDKDSGWYYGRYVGGRIKTPADVRVRIRIEAADGALPVAKPDVRWSNMTTAVEFKRGDKWVDRYSLRAHGTKNVKAAEEHREILAMAIAFAGDVLSADPDILRRAQIAWHRTKIAQFERKIDEHRSKLHEAQASKAEQERLIAAL